MLLRASPRIHRHALFLTEAMASTLRPFTAHQKGAALGRPTAQRRTPGALRATSAGRPVILPNTPEQQVRCHSSIAFARLARYLTSWRKCSAT